MAQKPQTMTKYDNFRLLYNERFPNILEEQFNVLVKNKYFKTPIGAEHFLSQYLPESAGFNTLLGKLTPQNTSSAADINCINRKQISLPKTTWWGLWAKNTFCSYSQ